MSVEDYNVRGLVVALSKLLPDFFTFNQIAELLYRGGILSKPERPYGTYKGYKSDYVKERMASVHGDEDFFLYVLPEIFSQIDMEYSESVTKDIVRWCTKLGYEIRTETYKDADQDLYAEWRELVPPKSKGTYSRTRGNAGFQIDDSELPTYLKELTRQLNANLDGANYDAAALLIRRIIFVSCITFLKAHDKADTLVDSKGDFKDIGALIEMVSQIVPDVSVQLQGRLRIAKWMGDNANHTSIWKANESEVEMASMALNQFLTALFRSQV